MNRGPAREIRRLVFWCNIPSPHQLPYIRELAALPEFEDVVLVAAGGISMDRASLGWENPVTGRVRLFITPNAATVVQLLSMDPQKTVHLLGGLRGHPYGPPVLKGRLREGFGCGLISESPDDRGWKGHLRRFRYFVEAVRYHRRIDFILAMGENGTRWFRGAGWPGGTLFPFAYVTESFPVKPEARAGNEPARTVQLAYVGRLIYQKGVDLLIRALQQIPPNLDWRLSVIGSGEMDAELRRLARELGVGSRIVFRGVVPHSQVPEAMCRSDLLLFPSRCDGWGAVVNESLMCGTPVLCSDHCGARDLLKEPWRGEVLSSDAMPAWTEALGRWIQKGPLPARERTRIADWSRCIGGPEIARYFNAILKHVYQDQSRPAPPWTYE